MTQSKMKFGIDLGTTNSAICKMEGGETVIKKTDTLKDTLPSCVSFTKKRIAKVGDSAYNDLRQDKSRATKKWSNDHENFCSVVLISSCRSFEGSQIIYR